MFTSHLLHPLLPVMYCKSPGPRKRSFPSSAFLSIDLIFPLALALPEVGYPVPPTSLGLQAKFDPCLPMSERMTSWDILLGSEVGGVMGARAGTPTG